ncbi:hypothetical protein FH972_022085 [Carpinus fangiana]|uniref:CID domain-containing protein n=1 Tax=Carpinus fangiana TaxID=176857 RepID=A0A5N6KRS3_9ROSI|nr:hypothetical protein FH972_022085 [Carpinus fangiana]
MAAVAELDAALQALRALKPPGVTKSRIASITQLCVENVKNESVLVQKIYTQFKRTPATHKLGVLYVVDSVTRQWIEKATASGENLTGGSSNADGTYAAGVQRMTDLLPLLVKDVISSAPEDQKDKITKLVDIWDRGNIFPAKMIQEFKTKLDARPSPRKPVAQPAGSYPDSHPAPTSTTPLGNPPPPQLHQSGPSASEILRGLTAATSQQPPFQAPTNAFPQPPPFPLPAFPNLSQPSYLPQQPQMPQLPQPPTTDSNPAAAALRALEGMLPPGAAQDPAQLQHWISILQELQSRGVPPDQWPEVIRIMSEQQKGPQQAAAQSLPLRSDRDRSRSPNRRRGSPVYETYGGGYRQRSPIRNDSPIKAAGGVGGGNDRPRRIEYDPSLPQGNIKVYSRTLFIGGSTCGEAELRRIFSRFGEVQTCIAHPERRHAFIKMKTRAESQAAKDGMDATRDPEITSRVRSTRWGVGFGPRDCSDYATGISVIPIDRLTEADKKWTLTAEYGGTGGKAIESNMVLEEPDIEIGAGVSSKAISQRPSQLNNDKGPANRRNEERRGGERRGGSGGRNRSDVNNIPVGGGQQNQQDQMSMAPQQTAFAMPQMSAFPAPPVHYDPSAFSGMPAGNGVESICIWRNGGGLYIAVTGGPDQDGKLCCIPLPRAPCWQTQLLSIMLYQLSAPSSGAKSSQGLGAKRYSDKPWGLAKRGNEERRWLQHGDNELSSPSVARHSETTGFSLPCLQVEAHLVVTPGTVWTPAESPTNRTAMAGDLSPHVLLRVPRWPTATLPKLYQASILKLLAVLAICFFILSWTWILDPHLPAWITGYDDFVLPDDIEAKTYERFDKLVKEGGVFYEETEPEVYTDRNGSQFKFIFRIAPHLIDALPLAPISSVIRKPGSPEAEFSQHEQRFDISFLDPSPEHVIYNFRDTHRLILSRTSLYRPSLILATNSKLHTNGWDAAFTIREKPPPAIPEPEIKPVVQAADDTPTAPSNPGSSSLRRRGAAAHAEPKAAAVADPVGEGEAEDSTTSDEAEDIPSNDDNLTPADLSAAWALIRAFRGTKLVISYDCGLNAGAFTSSRPEHEGLPSGVRYMEAFPAPERRIGHSLWPARAPATRNPRASPEKQPVAWNIPTVPFAHLVIQYPPSSGVGVIVRTHARLLALTRQIQEAAEVASPDYNMIMTSGWMAMVPRQKSSPNSRTGVKAEGENGPWRAGAQEMLGMVGVRDDLERERWGDLGYGEYLKWLGIPGEVD